MKKDSLQNIWYVADGALKVLHYDANKQEYRRVTNEQFLKGALIENFEDVNLYKANKVVAGTEEGFSLITLDSLPVKQMPLTLQSLLDGIAWFAYLWPQLFVWYSTDSDSLFSEFNANRI